MNTHFIDNNFVNILVNTISEHVVLIDSNFNILFANKVFNEEFNPDNKTNLKEVILCTQFYEKFETILNDPNFNYDVFTLKVDANNIYNQIFEIKVIKYLEYYLILCNNKTALLSLMEDLKKARENEEIAKKAQMEFLSNLSHEIRTPMNGVIGMADLLSETELDDEQLEYVNLIKKSSKSLMMLLNSLFDVSKYENQEIELVNENFEFIELIESCVKSVAGLVQAKNLKFNYEVDKDIPETLYGDFNKLRQLISNVLHNAVKFTLEGSINFVVKKEASRINTIGKEFVKLLFIIADTGIGIKEEIRDKVYDRFFQGDTVMFKNYSGVGLGLTIAKQIVNLMKGDIWFESVVGKGTIFYISLELEKVSKDSIDQNVDDYSRITSNIRRSSEIEQLVDLNISSDAVSKNRKFKVLIVDDNKLNQQVISSILEKYSFSYKIVNNGLEAINELRNEKYDLIFMDMMMPVMDGIETTNIIRSKQYSEIDPNIKIIALTAFTQKELENRYADLKIDGILTKPFHKNEILKVLKNNLDINNITENIDNNIRNDEIFNYNEVLERLDGDYDLLNKIYLTFTQDIFKYLFSVIEAVEKGDYESAKLPLHTMKSLSSNIGADKLTKIIVTMESLLEEGAFTKFHEYINTLKNEIKQFINYAETKIKEIYK